MLKKMEIWRDFGIRLDCIKYKRLRKFFKRHAEDGKEVLRLRLILLEDEDNDLRELKAKTWMGKMSIEGLL
jgi:hypothetical protein